MFKGCNIENASYTPTICAERVAVFKAVSEGHRDFLRIAIAADSEQFIYPCGVCRQVLNEFAPDIQILLVNKHNQVVETTLRELLPHGFNSSYLI